MLRSLKSFLAWLNGHPIAPWILAIAGAVYGFAKYETTVSAQESRVTELKTDIGESLQRIERQQDAILERVETLQDKTRDLGSDLSIVCEKLQARCRYR